MNRAQLVERRSQLIAGEATAERAQELETIDRRLSTGGQVEVRSCGTITVRSGVQ